MIGQPVVRLRLFLLGYTGSLRREQISQMNAMSCNYGVRLDKEEEEFYRLLLQLLSSGIILCC